jgi:hypothetical protein
MQTRWLFALSPTGFRHRDVRAQVAPLLGRDPEAYAAGQMTYDWRRRRLHGLIERVPDSHRYRITERGATTAMLYVRLYGRARRPTASLKPSGAHRGRQAFERLDVALANLLQEVHLAA